MRRYGNVSFLIGWDAAFVNSELNTFIKLLWPCSPVLSRALPVAPQRHRTRRRHLFTVVIDSALGFKIPEASLVPGTCKLTATGSSEVSVTTSPHRHVY
mgnify:CR=1 FL=1